MTLLYSLVSGALGYVLVRLGGRFDAHYGYRSAWNLLQYVGIGFLAVGTLLFPIGVAPYVSWVFVGIVALFIVPTILATCWIMFFVKARQP